MKVLMQCWWIGFAGFFGAVTRFIFAMTCIRVLGHGWSWIGTLFINLTGSFFLGWFLAYTRQRGTFTDNTQLAIAVGFVGAYTTFSTFMNESNELMRNGSMEKAMINLIGSLILGLLAVRAGLWLGAR